MSRLTASPSQSQDSSARKTKSGDRARSSSSGFPSASSSAASSNPKRPSTSNSDGNSNSTPSRPKVDVSHFPHYGLKRGMACTFCRRRKLRCSGDRPSCTNCVKYTKTCEYGPPVKDPKKLESKRMNAAAYGVMPRHAVQMGASQMQPVPMYGTQTPQLDYAHGASAIYVDHHSVASDSALQAQGGVVSPFEHRQTINTYHRQYFSQAVPLSQNVSQQAQIDQPQTTMGLPVYIPGSTLGTYPDPSVQWQQPTTPALQPSSGFLTPLQAPSATMSDSYSVDALRESQMTSGDMFLAANTAGLPASSEHSASSADGHRSGRQSSAESFDVCSPVPLASRLYIHQPSLHYVEDVNVLDGLTDRLGEFLFNPTHGEEEPRKRQKSSLADSKGGSPRTTAVPRSEYDGLSDSARTRLINCFISHSELFFEMSIPRFRYRMTFSDRRRPSLALLNAMYVWATRISDGGTNTAMEKQFFDQAFKHLHVTTATTDRLLDAVHASYLLAVYSFLSARHHEGWCLAGIAVRLVISCGLHRIPSSKLQPAEEQNPFLRHRTFLLQPPEDTVELADRIHAFWAVYALDRCGALCTGYPVTLRDDDITTPLPLTFQDIVTGKVVDGADTTVRDLFRGREITGAHFSARSRWTQCTAILERASKICFLDAEKDSPYEVAWNQYAATYQHQQDAQPSPADYLKQPKFRNPKAYHECIRAIDEVIKRNGDDGIFPPLRLLQAQSDGVAIPDISSSVHMFHHMVAATQMVLHDIDSLTAENPEALKAARKSVQLFQVMPTIPFTDVDAFIVHIWFMIAKVLVKEVRRLAHLADMEGAFMVAAEVDVVHAQLARVGMTMHLAKTQSETLEELKTAALSPVKSSGPTVNLNLENFLFNRPTS